MNAFSLTYLKYVKSLLICLGLKSILSDSGIGVPTFNCCIYLENLFSLFPKVVSVLDCEVNFVEVRKDLAVRKSVCVEGDYKNVPSQAEYH